MNESRTLFTTPSGHRRLLERLRRTRAEYDRVCASNEDAAAAGDNSVWHDNFAYEENQRQMHALARRLRDQQALAARVRIVRPPATPSRVCLGCAVTVENLEDGQQRTWLIGGYDDADRTLGRVSYTAPIARALLGGEEGDTRVLEVDGRRQELEILALRAATDEEV